MILSKNNFKNSLVGLIIAIIITGCIQTSDKDIEALYRPNFHFTPATNMSSACLVSPLQVSNSWFSFSFCTAAGSCHIF